MLKQTPSREWEEDAIDRPGEKTFRGFLISHLRSPKTKAPPAPVESVADSAGG
jgi:hypothetical protein